MYLKVDLLLATCWFTFVFHFFPFYIFCSVSTVHAVSTRFVCFIRCIASLWRSRLMIICLATHKVDRFIRSRTKMSWYESFFCIEHIFIESEGFGSLQSFALMVSSVDFNLPEHNFFRSSCSFPPVIFSGCCCWKKLSPKCAAVTRSWMVDFLCGRCTAWREITSATFDSMYVQLNHSV